MKRQTIWTGVLAVLSVPCSAFAQGPVLAPLADPQPSIVAEQPIPAAPAPVPHPYMNSTPQPLDQGVVHVQSEVVMPKQEVVLPADSEPARHLYQNPVFAGQAELEIHQGYHLPGGYAGRSGSPYYYSAPGAQRGFAPGLVVGAAGGDPYSTHFGPGYYRSGEQGHYRFPYYSYRRPWYHPGFAGYNRDTNLPW